MEPCKTGVMSAMTSGYESAGDASCGSRATVAGGRMAQPVHPQLRKYPCVPALALRAQTGHPDCPALYRITRKCFDNALMGCCRVDTPEREAGLREYLVEFALASLDATSDSKH